MHSISPYLIRSYNSNASTNDKYFSLNRVGQKDVLLLLNDFISENSKAPDDEPSEEFLNNDNLNKQVYYFSDVSFDAQKRTIHGWFNVGQYGTASDILRIETGDLAYRKTTKDADMTRHFFKFNLPVDVSRGICIFHTNRGHGIKTLFSDLFSIYFRQKTSSNIQFKPMSYEKALQKWADANVKEIRVKGFKGISDVADKLNGMGNNDINIVIKSNRGAAFGLFKQYTEQDTEQQKLVEMLEPLGVKTQTVLEINGKRRVFNIGHDEDNSICQIDVDDEVTLIDGIPILSSMNTWVDDILKEYIDQLYPQPQEPS